MPGGIGIALMKDSDQTSISILVGVSNAKDSPGGPGMDINRLYATITFETFGVALAHTRSSWTRRWAAEWRLPGVLE
jgi:hypothetical protein